MGSEYFSISAMRPETGRSGEGADAAQSYRAASLSPAEALRAP